jgi:hypothetical protein
VSVAADDKKAAPAASYRVIQGSVSQGIDANGDRKVLQVGDVFTPSPADVALMLAVGVIEAV